ncbi:hypothetical protein ACT3R4_17660 [Halomonas sp. AOP7-E1-9]|uniref:hypothetical protein n=1 Tax=Halomonas sp. TaxID=1486246 RepID=UPI003F943DD1
MSDEVSRILEERWQDYQAAIATTVEALKADPANRYASLKAWLYYIAKIATFSVTGSGVLLLCIFLGLPQLSQIWADIPLNLFIRGWSLVALFGIVSLPLLFLPPTRYWERRAEQILNEQNIPNIHRLF